MIALDANVLIARCNEADASHLRAVDVIDHHEWDEFLTSAVTLSEVLVRPTKDDWATVCQEYLRSIAVFVVPVEEDDAIGIADLAAEQNLKSADAVILHMAITTSEALVTFDKRLANVARAVGFPVITDAPEGSPDWAPPWWSGE